MARTKAQPTNRANLTASQVLIALRDQGISPSQTQAQAALAKVDQAAIRAKHRARVEWEIWDGQESPVASMTLLQFKMHQKARNGWDGESAIYLGYLDGKLQVIQPHEPEVEGFKPMDRAKAEAEATREAAERAEGYADAEIVDEVRKVLEG